MFMCVGQRARAGLRGGRGDRARRGFTLSQLLVTVAIIAVLMAIMIPSVAKARAAARRAECLANLRGLSRAAAEFANANNGKFMPVGGGQYWVPALQSYNEALTEASSRAKKVMLCPDALTRSGGTGTAALAWGPFASIAGTNGYNVGNYTGSYGLNGWAYNNNARSGALILGSSNTLQGMTVNGNVVCEGTLTLQANSYGVTGAAMANAFGGNAQNGTAPNVAGGITTPAPIAAGTTVAFIQAARDALTAGAGVQVVAPGNINGLNFSTASVIWVKGNAKVGGSVTGTGTLVVDGNCTDIPNGSYYIICLGDFTAKNWTLTGGVYAKGNVAINGHFTLTGVMMVGATLNVNGASSVITAGPAAVWDTLSPSVGGNASINSLTANAAQTPLFADCIWSDGWPVPSDVAKLSTINTSLGDASYGLGRFYINRHGSKSTNIVYLDGSAGTLPLKEMPTLKWGKGF